MREVIIKYFEEEKIEFNEEMVNKFLKYRDLLVQWNKKFNLTAIIDDKGIALKHFVDSLSIMDDVQGRRNLADVGTGAGFPGIPLKIAGFKGEIVLMDSLKKRIGFLDTVIEELGLENCRTEHIRAEDAGRSISLRETFEVVTARAVANLPVLCEYCLPLTKKGGIFIAMKGPEAGEELKSSKKAIGTLGGRLKNVKKINMDDFQRQIIIVEKIKKTPRIYPRKAGTPKKNPL